MFINSCLFHSCTNLFSSALLQFIDGSINPGHMTVVHYFSYTGIFYEFHCRGLRFGQILGWEMGFVPSYVIKEMVNATAVQLSSFKI